MKSRSLQSTFFTDPFIQELNLKQKWIYLYYLFNDKVNWLGCYEITDRTALFELDDNISTKDLQTAKKLFTEKNKILFVDNFVIIKNSEKYENHLTNSQLMKSALKQFQALPENIQKAFLSYKPDSVKNLYLKGFDDLGCSLHSSLLVGYSVDEVISISNKKEEININNKKKEKNEKLNFLLNKFNELFESKYQITDGRVQKYKARLKSFNDEQLLQALENMANTPFYKGENDRGWVANPDYFLRSDEIVDRLLNQTGKKQVKKNFKSEDTSRFADF